MPSLVDLPWLGAAIKLFLAALFAPVWWPVLVEVRAEILRSSQTSRERELGPKRVAQGFVARLHGERTPDARVATTSRPSRARRQFRAAR